MSKDQDVTDVGEAAQEDSAAQGAIESADRHRVLIVDDDRAVRDMFLRVLSYKLPDCQVDVAVSGEEAVSTFLSVHYGVILMDMRMPEMDGDVAFRKIAEVCHQNGWESPAVIFITGFEPTDGIREIVEADSRHCLLRKPVKKDDLLKALSERLDASSS